MVRKPLTRADVERTAADLVSELVAPGSLVARNFAQLNAAETLYLRCRDWFARHHATTPELAAVEIVAPLYAKRFPST